MPTSKTTHTATRRWLSTSDLCESQGISRSLLADLKRTGVVKAGTHYRRLGLNPKSRLQWLESAVEELLIAQTVELEAEALEVIK